MRGSVFKRGRTWTYVLSLGREPVSGKKRQRWVGGFKTKADAELALTRALTAQDAGGGGVAFPYAGRQPTIGARRRALRNGDRSPSGATDVPGPSCTIGLRACSDCIATEVMVCRMASTDGGLPDGNDATTGAATFLGEGERSD